MCAIWLRVKLSEVTLGRYWKAKNVITAKVLHDMSEVLTWTDMDWPKPSTEKILADRRYDSIWLGLGAKHSGLPYEHLETKAMIKDPLQPPRLLACCRGGHMCGQTQIKAKIANPPRKQVHDTKPSPTSSLDHLFFFLNQLRSVKFTNIWDISKLSNLDEESWIDA